VKCLIETYSSVNGKKKKNNLLKQLHNLIANRETEKMDIPYTHIHDHSLSLVGTGTLIKLVVVNLVF